MNLNLNINIDQLKSAFRSAETATPAPAGNAKSDALSALSGASLSITERIAAPEDVEAAAIPEDALRRDDDLGKLVSSVFNFPAPPPPPFPADV